MPRRVTRVIEVEGDYQLESDELLQVMRDLQLYTRFPVLVAFRPKMIRLLSRTRQLMEKRIRDTELRKLYYDIVEEFMDFLWELQQTHMLPTGFAAFMKERNNRVADRFVVPAQAGPVVLT